MQTQTQQSHPYGPDFEDALMGFNGPEAKAAAEKMEQARLKGAGAVSRAVDELLTGNGLTREQVEDKGGDDIPDLDLDDPLAIMQQAQTAALPPVDLGPTVKVTEESFLPPRESAMAKVDELAAVAKETNNANLANVAESLTDIDRELQVRKRIAEIEERFIEAVRSSKNAAAKITEKQNEFNLANADLLGEKKAAEKLVTTIREELDPLLIEFRKLTGEAKFDEYLATTQNEIFDIKDRAAAVTWAESNYTAAINHDLNDKLIQAYIKDQWKNNQQLPAWASRRVEIKPAISTKI